MILILNTMGAAMALGAGFFGWLLSSYVFGKEHIFVLFIGLFAITEDLICRIIMRNKVENVLLTLVGARSGGEIFFMPVWVWGRFDCYR